MTEKINNNNFHEHPSSFRDPSGAVFYYEGSLYRQINTGYQKHYDLVMKSGLYGALLKKNLMIPHREVAPIIVLKNVPYKTIKPEYVDFISYPYEWSFGGYKDAALATLKIQKLALAHGLVLKDASAYNIQCHKGRLKLIDTLSFEAYEEGRPWIAYKQFCQHFLAPLALMAKKDVRLGSLMRQHIDGLPLDLTSKILPASSYLRLSILMHIHLHALSQKRYAAKNIDNKKLSFSLPAMMALIDSLEKGIKKLSWQKKDTEWGDYYNHTNYQDIAFADKSKIITGYIEQIKPQSVWDLGGNTGIFSRLAGQNGAFTVSFDIDPAAVQKNYLTMKKNKETNMLPLVLDLANPSPGLGWAHEERDSLVQRGPADLVMALALIHHLSISNNLPFKKVAEYFARLGKYLIIEFVPKTDSNAKRLLSTRQDIFSEYDQDNFEKTFDAFFEPIKRDKVKGSERILYLYKTK